MAKKRRGQAPIPAVAKCSSYVAGQPQPWHRSNHSSNVRAPQEAIIWRVPPSSCAKPPPALDDRQRRNYNPGLLISLRPAGSLSAWRLRQLGLATTSSGVRFGTHEPDHSVMWNARRPASSVVDEAGADSTCLSSVTAQARIVSPGSTTRCGYCNPAATGRPSIALRPGRWRQTISDSSTASVNLGQRRNRDFSAHRASMRAS